MRFRIKHQETGILLYARDEVKHVPRIDEAIVISERLYIVMSVLYYYDKEEIIIMVNA